MQKETSNLNIETGKWYDSNGDEVIIEETKNKFKVEVRKNCKVCGADLPTKKHRTYCSPVCRNKANYQKNKEYSRNGKIIK
jgi:predicted nucleic acid-binding Zn ribbon protein